MSLDDLHKIAPAAADTVDPASPTGFFSFFSFVYC